MSEELVIKDGDVTIKMKSYTGDLDYPAVISISWHSNHPTEAWLTIEHCREIAQYMLDNNLLEDR